MAQFVVTNLEEAGEGSLRQAIEDANAQSGADEIIFDESLSSGKITFDGGEVLDITGRRSIGPVEITDSLTITGPGASELAVSGGNDIPVFIVNDGSGNTIDVEISGLTITEGSNIGFRATGIGGGIINGERLTINESIITESSAGDSAAGINNFGILNVKNSLITNNSIGNKVPASNRGAGILNNGTATIENSTIANNTVLDGSGGGIANRGTLEIVNSTITGNVSQRDSSRDSPSNGAGIFNEINPRNPDNLPSVTITSSIVAGNSGNKDIQGDAFSSDGVSLFTSGGNNLIGNGDGVDVFVDGENGDIVGTAANPIDPVVGTLQDNGGATPTIALLDDSPAIDAGSNPNNLIRDQRGEEFPRELDGSGNGQAIADIGAFEVQDSTTGREIRGTDGDDVLSGTEGNDTIFGLTGNDSIKGGSDGKDILWGDGGNDTLDGGPLADSLLGAEGDDLLLGGNGNDTIDGGLGNDSIDAGVDSDLVFGSEGNDTILGSSGKDTLIGGIGTGNDSLDGGVGNDELIGRDGNDTLVGGSSGDTLDGGIGDDLIAGGDNDDIFVLTTEGGIDTITDFGNGNDVLGISEEISFSDLSFSGNEIIFGDSTLATLNSFDTTTLTENDFMSGDFISI